MINIKEQIAITRQGFSTKALVKNIGLEVS